jgi:ABC-type uncharacterized transport system substrate-binding protein
LVGDDPARLGLVASLARPGGNLTGINVFNAELAAKRLELLREVVPGAKRVAVLVSPADAALTDPQLKAVNAAAGVAVSDDGLRCVITTVLRRACAAACRPHQFDMLLAQV